MYAQTLNEHITFRHSSMIHIEYLFCLGRCICKSPLLLPPPLSFSNRIRFGVVVVDKPLNISRIHAGNSSPSFDVVWNWRLFWLILGRGVVEEYSFKMANIHGSMAGVVVRTKVVGVVCWIRSCAWAECLSISFAPIFVGLLADHSFQNELMVVGLGGFGVVNWMNWPFVFWRGGDGTDRLVVVFGSLTIRTKSVGSLNEFNAI